MSGMTYRIAFTGKDIFRPPLKMSGMTYRIAFTGKDIFYDERTNIHQQNSFHYSCGMEKVH
jgi:hypothetical protein